jgi:2-aminoadipate transaminase
MPAVAPEAAWTRPTGGLYVWVTLPQSIDTGRQGPLFAKALDSGVLYVPGDYCYGPDSTRNQPHNTMRLSFGVPNVEQIHEGIKRLCASIGQCTD